MAYALLVLAGGCGATDDGTGSSAEERSSTVAAGNTEQLDQSRIHHPSTLAFSAPFTVMAQQNTSLDGADEVTYETWDSPDVLRSLRANGDTSISATKKAGHPVTPLMDLQSEWAEITGQPQPRLPQAGVVVYGDLPEKNPQAVVAARDPRVQACTPPS